MGKSLLERLCKVFNVSEGEFTRQTAAEQLVKYGNIPDVTRMLLNELQKRPEYEQLRWLADLKEKKAKEL